MLLSEIRNVVKAVALDGCKINLLLEGHQGIGKTQILQQVAKELGWDYKAVYCAQTSTEDLIGMPWIDKTDNVTRFAKPKLFPDKEGTIFVLEEINRAPLEVQQAVLQFLTDKKLGDYVLPKNTLICACINPVDNVYQTQELDSVFINRLVKIDVETNQSEFIKYAESIGVDENIINFIDKLNSSEAAIHFTQAPTMDTVGKPLPSPRAWMMVDKILKLEIKSKSLLLEMIKGALGKETAVKFTQTLGKLNKVLSINQILNGFDKVKDQLDKQNDGVMHKIVSDFADLLVKKDKSCTDEQYLNTGKFIEYVCDTHKPLAALLYQKVTNTDDLKGTVFAGTTKYYKDNEGKNLLTTLISIGQSLK
jgi:alkaline phosphatase D